MAPVRRFEDLLVLRLPRLTVLTKNPPRRFMDAQPADGTVAGPTAYGQCCHAFDGSQYIGHLGEIS
jgi:hypothetical protein